MLVNRLFLRRFTKKNLEILQRLMKRMNVKKQLANLKRIDVRKRKKQTSSSKE